MAPFLPTPLTRSTLIYQLFGANTGVGKTVVSTTLCKAIQSRGRLRKNESGRSNVLFLKPVSTGPLEDADDMHIDRYVQGITTKCLFRYDEPVSPHLASRGHQPSSDPEICNSISETLHNWARSNSGFALVETAGGVLSPGPNGTLQADLYRPLRLPVILVADSRLGGISSTVSAYESLFVRGYEVEAIVVFRDEYYRNHEFLRDFAYPRNVPLLTLPKPPAQPLPDAGIESVVKDKEAMAAFYSALENDSQVIELLETLETRHARRIERLESMAQKAREIIWYPFTQHQGLKPEDITVIDSAHDDCYQTLKPDNGDKYLIQPTFDGSSSWWTQGIGHGNAALAMEAAHTAGRYGHVIFAGTIHEPALALSELMLKTLQNPRLGKVFFSDNGSTGMEVAVKMGLRAACKRYAWDHTKENIEILGLKGSYHGDTIGVMDCSEPGVYNKKVEWYRGRGHWFDFPLVKMVKGKWMVSIPEELKGHLGEDAEFPTLSAIFNLKVRQTSPLADKYKSYIKTTLEDLVSRQGRKFGALIIEPVLLGAGGMLLSDPLFQHVLVRTVRENPQLIFPSSTITTATNQPASESSTTATPSQAPPAWSGLPIIFDEVFTGLYRLGRRTASSFLGVDPDIVVNAKLLTGGMVPLCTTAASDEIFRVFESPQKSDALLHGHSYTANPVGCAVASHSVRTMIEMEASGAWKEYVDDWKIPSERQTAAATAAAAAAAPAAAGAVLGDPKVWSCWSRELVRDLSFADNVESVFALGTVLSITLRDQTGQGGYTSTASAGLQQQLKASDGGFNIHSRVLGNVLYLMASLTSKREYLQNIEALLRKSLL
ncbi:hypothetical protein VTO42DRAFT_8238 [Malbranchea cinnamomea]